MKGLTFFPGLFLGLVGMDQTAADACFTCDSGLLRFCIIECEGVDLEASTFDPETGCITGLAANGTGFAAEYVPDADNTGYLNFVGERTGAVHNVNIDGFAKFRCLNKDKIAEANRLKEGCCYIIVAEYNDCTTLVAGIDILKNCSIDGELRFGKQFIRATVSVIPGDGTDESRVEVVFEGQQRCFTALDTDVATYDDVKAVFGL